MKTSYHVTANNCDFGIIVAISEQDARDQAAMRAGYKNETDLCRRVGCEYSDIIARPTTQKPLKF